MHSPNVAGGGEAILRLLLGNFYLGGYPKNQKVAGVGFYNILCFRYDTQIKQAGISLAIVVLIHVTGHTC